IAISELPKPNIDLQKSKCYQKIPKKIPSHEVFEVSSQETFKGERTFVRVLYRKTLNKRPQDMYMDLQHESEIFISDLEFLNDWASFQETFKGKVIFKGLPSQETFVRREHIARFVYDEKIKIDLTGIAKQLEQEPPNEWVVEGIQVTRRFRDYQKKKH
ncbi:12525_t:CDS:2, partial [Cetraspora pellucida]